MKPEEGILKGTTKTIKSIQEQIAQYPFWYHRIELPGGIVTPGMNPLSQESYQIPEDLTGKRVLDVGAWDGYWSFEALRRGAKEVVAIDDFSDFLGSLDQSDRKAWETFDLCRDAFGYSEDICKRMEMSVYDVDEIWLSRFDVIFCFGTLYHLRHPLLALDRLSDICDGEIYVESAISDDYSPYQGGFEHGYANNHMIMEFYPNNELAGNSTNYWAPTLLCLGNMIGASGFSNVKVWKLMENPTQVGFCRGFAVGNKRPKEEVLK
jgi:tRNA (mo5U34)-methyltransferase